MLSIKIIRYLIVPLLAIFLYYNYLNNLYLVDEYLEVDYLTNLSIDDKFTIRVLAPNSFEHLKTFVERYSMCPNVHEIQILQKYSDPLKKLSESSFAYESSHSKVTVVKVPNSYQFISPFIPNIEILTEAIMLLDPSVIVSCDNLAFTHSVWRSSKLVPVGYIPRLHRILKSKHGRPGNHKNDNVYTYYSGIYVWLYQKFSLLTSKAIMFSSSELQKISNSILVHSFLDHDIKCLPIISSIWYESIEVAAPIWVKVPFSVDSTVKLSYENVIGHTISNTTSKVGNSHKNNEVEYLWDNLKNVAQLSSNLDTDLKYTKCITGLARSLNITTISFSSMKSVRASKLLFW